VSEPVEVRPLMPFNREQALAAWRANPDSRPSASAFARAWGVPRSTARRWLAQFAPAADQPTPPMPGQHGHLPAMSRPATGLPPVGRVLAALVIGLVGIGLAAIGMTATITYSVETTGIVMGAIAAAADVMALVMPAAASALWGTRRRLLAMAAWAMWATAAMLATVNVAGFIGQHTDSFLGARQLQSTERALVLERLGRLRAERTTIAESRPVGAITVAIRNAGRAEIDGQRAALATAKRRDEIERDLAALEPRFATLPAVTMVDPSAGVLAEILQLPSEIDLRRIRLALLLVLPLCAGPVLAIGIGVMGSLRPATGPGKLDPMHKRSKQRERSWRFRNNGVPAVVEKLTTKSAAADRGRRVG
jgi:hypothetical protein